MLNLHAKKPVEEYNEQNVVQIIEAKLVNSQSKCNFCGGKIYWNPCVIHRHTKKKLPLSQPYLGHGTQPQAHRQCKYNTENFFTQLVILESDSPYVKATKMKQQDKLRGNGLVETLILNRTPEEIQDYAKFKAKSTEQSFTGGK